MVAMVTGKLVKIPCYRLMFFNGITDIMDLIAGAWFGSTFNCIVLALNRVVEMIPAAQGLRFLFRGKLFLQALVICASTAIAAVSYVFVEFIEVPRAVVILANVTWQLSHGVHGIVYICLNKLIRAEVCGLLQCKKRSKSLLTSTHTITVAKASGTTSRDCR
ncbi:hypothetical protein ANCCEY_11041 [Ancylostoma ceylanicum]|uniref:7TM GPCR serpentine receptor class x (Srx) domain-containing protein n=1 Tax=Ancylostoma ceylanicum TaxID=53326 RepID=A0A0D6LQE9_9BILA|nr:hypothetical protein ANCCEY_11041 [Ancylostoma ceylanicum]